MTDVDVREQRVMKTPRSVEIDITSRCNLRCTYCLHFDTAGDVATDLPTQEWLSFFEELGRLSVLTVTLSGGEPFLREDLKEIVEGIVRNRMRFDIVSNGTLIDDKVAHFLASTGRCDNVQISIDGSRPETHDACRGTGSFQKAMEGLRCLQRNGVTPAVRFTIHKHNLGNVKETAEFLLEDMELPAFSCNSACPMGLCKSTGHAIQLSATDASYAMKQLMWLKDKYGGRIKAAAGPLALLSQFREMQISKQENSGGVAKGGRLLSCGGTWSKIAVRADGVIVPCSLLTHIELGRINRDSLRDIWTEHPELTRLRRRGRISLSRFEFCSGCDYLGYCAGGCPGTAYSTFGTDEHPSSDGCVRLFLEQGGVFPETVVAAGEVDRVLH